MTGALVRALRAGYDNRMASTAVEEAATEQVKEAAKERVAGDSPSPPRALLVAVVVGIAAAAATYKVLRG
jgi:hypothetical protein